MPSPTNVTWTKWGRWTPCSKRCGDGVKFRRSFQLWKHIRINFWIQARLFTWNQSRTIGMFWSTSAIEKLQSNCLLKWCCNNSNSTNNWILDNWNPKLCLNCISIIKLKTQYLTCFFGIVSIKTNLSTVLMCYLLNEFRVQVYIRYNT